RAIARNLRRSAGRTDPSQTRAQKNSDLWLTNTRGCGIIKCTVTIRSCRIGCVRRDERRGGITTMSEIRVRENESLESALRRFKRSCARSGVIAEVRKREHYEKPSVKRKKKAEAARKRKY